MPSVRAPPEVGAVVICVVQMRERTRGGVSVRDHTGQWWGRDLTPGPLPSWWPSLTRPSGWCPSVGTGGVSHGREAGRGVPGKSQVGTEAVWAAQQRYCRVAPALSHRSPGLGADVAVSPSQVGFPDPMPSGATQPSPWT